MKAKTLYTCEICLTDYAEKADAIKCEREHKKYECVKDFRYQAHSPYPTKVEVKFADGMTHWYKIG